MRLLNHWFSGGLVLLSHLALVGMDYIDTQVSLEQVIATKDAKKIRAKIVALWPGSFCTVYLLLNQLQKENPVLEAVGIVDPAEVNVSVEVRRRQAQALKDYLLLQVVYPALDGKIYAQEAFQILDNLAGSGVSGVWGIFGEATSQNAQDSVAILKSLIYNNAPKTFDTQYDQPEIAYFKRVFAFIRYQGSSLRMKNFQRGIYQDYLCAQRRMVHNLTPKNTLDKKWLLGAGAVLCVVAAYAYTRFALDKDGQKLKHGETETEVDGQEEAIAKA